MSSIPHHLVLVPQTHRNRMRCDHCGTTAPLPQPLSLSQFDLLTKDFIRKHRHCRKSQPLRPASAGHG